MVNRDPFRYGIEGGVIPVITVHGTLYGLPGDRIYSPIVHLVNQAYNEALRALGGIDRVREAQHIHRVQFSYRIPAINDAISFSPFIPVIDAPSVLLSMLQRDASYNGGEPVALEDLLHNKEIMFQFHLDQIAGGDTWQTDPFKFNESFVSQRRLHIVPLDLTRDNNDCVFVSLLIAPKIRNNFNHGSESSLEVETRTSYGSRIDWTDEVIRNEILGRARELRNLCSIPEDNTKVSLRELQQIADVTKWIIHVFRREASNAEIMRVIPADIRLQQDRLVRGFHVFIYLVGEHCHAVRNPVYFGVDPKKKDSILLDDVTSSNLPHLCCHWCLKTFKNKKNAIAHDKLCKKNFMNLSTDVVEVRRMLGSQIEHRRFKPQFKRRGNLVVCLHCKERDIPAEKQGEHVCYCEAKPKKQVEDERLFFWDIEAMFDAPMTDIEVYKVRQTKDGRTWEFKKQPHHVNCVVLMNVAGDTWVFDTMDEFCFFIFDTSNEAIPENAIFIAHNGGGYDVHFLVEFLMRHGKSPSMIPSSGSSPTRLIALSVDGKSFVDSLKFIPQPLGTFGKAFNLEIEKGYFPYEFNTVDNQDYEGEMPERSWYGIENTKCNSIQDYEKTLRQFETWYEEERRLFEPFTDRKWSLKEHLVKYCVQDVDVLRQGCLKFRQMCLSLTDGNTSSSSWKINNVDPFCYLTLSSMVMSIALQGFPAKSIVACPKEPDRDADSYRLVYLNYLESQGYQIIHQQVRNTFLVHTIRKHGESQSYKWIHGHCYDIGCPGCYPDDRALHVNPFKNQTLESLYNDFVKEASTHQFCIVSFDHDLHKLPIESIQDSLFRHMAIQPREALYGGRTEPFKLYAKGELYHIDVVSLYPTVCAYDELPIGRWTEFCDRDRILSMIEDRTLFGFVRCSVLPPKDLLIPFLPHRRESDGRLVFSLEPMTGCWTTVDLFFALDQGYQMTEAYRAIHFAESERKVGPFYDYVNLFIQIKQRAKEQGNKTLYLIAKLFLNTLWGKFVEQPHTSNLTVVNSAKAYYDLLYSPHINTESMRWLEAGQETWMVRYDLEDRFSKHSRNYNPFLGSFVLAHARRRLHTQMVNVGLENVCYCDTDSIAFIKQPWHDLHAMCGEELGDWSNEVDEWEHGNHISEFIGIGPKSYCESYANPQDGTPPYLLKFKGVRLIRDTHDRLNPESLKELVFDYCTTLNHASARSSIGVSNWTINHRYRNSLLGQKPGEGEETTPENRSGNNSEAPSGGESKEDGRGCVESFSVQNMKLCSVNLTKRMLLCDASGVELGGVTEIQTFPIGYDTSGLTAIQEKELTYKH